MNFQPTKKLIKQLGGVKNMDTFSRDYDLSWPKEVLEYLRKEHGISPSVNDSLVGGKMDIPVLQHEDGTYADISVVWFPKIHGGIVFTHGEGCEQSTVSEGDIFVFDHRLPHSVSANVYRGRHKTGVWYYMAQGFDKVLK